MNTPFEEAAADLLDAAKLLQKVAAALAPNLCPKCGKAPLVRVSSNCWGCKSCGHTTFSRPKEPPVPTETTREKRVKAPDFYGQPACPTCSATMEQARIAPDLEPFHAWHCRNCNAHWVPYYNVKPPTR